MTQSLTTTDGRSVLRMERHLRHAPERVWPALVESARLADWFPSEVTIDLRPGGTVTYGDGTQSGVVTDLDPPAWSPTPGTPTISAGSCAPTATAAC